VNIKKPDSLRLEVTLPANSQGTVHAPKTGLRNMAVTAGGRSVWKAGAFVTGTPGLYAASEDIDYITFDVGSGSYSFELTGQPDHKIMLIQ